jgi:hypothetical protein
MTMVLEPESLVGAHGVCARPVNIAVDDGDMVVGNPGRTAVRPYELNCQPLGDVIRRTIG